MRPKKRFLQFTALLFLAVLLLSFALLHQVSINNHWCLTCEAGDGGSSPAEHGNVESISPTKPGEADNGTFAPHSYAKREDSRAFTFPKEKTEGSRTVTLPYKPDEDSRAYASPYMYTYNEIPMCLNYTHAAHQDVRRRKPGSKLILYWQHHEVFPIIDDFTDLCRRSLSHPCEITFDERLHAKADAIVFHASRLSLPKPPFKKRRGQIWIARGLESPIHWNDCYRSALWRRKFNWTMTYRPDSEIFNPVGSLVEMPAPPDKDFREIAANKTRSVAWFVSDCHTVSGREEYVKQLQKHIDVDIFGSCGRLDCPKHDSVCDAMLSEKYRFYLSFENSLCPHYVTEKFFKKYGGFERSVDIIPVVRGGTDYRKYFPEGTFINTEDFRSPKQLANFLNAVGANVEVYAAMLKRKSLFRTNHCVKKDAWCKLCEKLHETHMTSHIYEDLAAWWDQEACLERKDVTDIKK